jgi:RHS repeat-associated protein
MVATITVTPHILTGNNPSCTPPSPGDWIISSSCTFTGVAIVPQSVIVNAGKELILAPSSKLLIDLKHYKLLVKKGGGVLIKHTAALRQLKASDTGTNIYYQLTDNLSGQGVTTDSSGNTVELLDYYPYGLARLDEKTGTLTEQRKYTGQEYDASTGLNYYNARYYNASVGKFTSQDSSVINTPEKFLQNPQQLNYYSYAGDNPILNVDPSGNVYFSSGTLGQNIGGFGVGVLQGGWGFVKGTFNTVFHAYDSFVAGRQSLDSISNLITNGILNPTATNQAISQSLSDSYTGFESKSAYEQGKTAGNFTGQLEAGILAGAGASKALNTVQAGTKLDNALQSGKFFDGSHYSPKVLGQMAWDDYHGFPESVTSFAKDGNVSTFTGGDKKIYQELNIPGNYKGVDGSFQFYKNSGGEINHRVFIPGGK